MSWCCSGAAQRIVGTTPARSVFATAQQAWYGVLAVAPVFIEPGSSGEHGNGESVNGTLRDKVPNSALFSTLHEAQVIVEGWHHCSNTHRPHRARGVVRPP